jgi:hypothetical protein
VEHAQEPSSPGGGAIAIVAALATTLTLFLPSIVYLTNSREFAATYADVLASGLALAVALSLPLWLGLIILDRAVPAWRAPALALLCGVAFLVWLQGNFLLWPYGLLDGSEIPWAEMRKYGYADGCLWLVVVITTLVFSRRVVRAAKPVGWPPAPSEPTRRGVSSSQDARAARRASVYGVAISSAVPSIPSGPLDDTRTST